MIVKRENKNIITQLINDKCELEITLKCPYLWLLSERISDNICEPSCKSSLTYSYIKLTESIKLIMLMGLLK